MAKLFFMLSLFFMTPVLSYELYSFKSNQQRDRFYALTGQFRCLVCQNENLIASNSALANDLKARVYQLMGEGKTDYQISDYMDQRYGDFVLFRPPLKYQTGLLWLGPGLFLLTGLIIMRFFLKRGKTK